MFSVAASIDDTLVLGSKGKLRREPERIQTSTVARSVNIRTAVLRVWALGVNSLGQFARSSSLAGNRGEPRRPFLSYATILVEAP
ncbi:MAG: hypothetical protein DYG96_11910 [Chlorobi bacterium CHB2]|nr:hypothetical protein [Chlorobi bacterium CHB2]